MITGVLLSVVGGGAVILSQGDPISSFGMSGGIDGVSCASVVTSL